MYFNGPSVNLFFKILIGILATIGAVVVLGILAIVAMYFMLVRRVTLRVRRSLAELETKHGMTIDADGLKYVEDLDGDESNFEYSSETGIPPMRIHLVPTGYERWRDLQVVERISKWLAVHGFTLVGDFQIAEMEEECLRVFLSQDKLLVGAIRQDEFGNVPYIEFCFDLGAGQRGGVSNPPCETIPLPEGAIGEHFGYNFEASVRGLSKMLDRAAALAKAHDARPINRDCIPQFFEEAHATEMDARIVRGGLTKDEIQAVFKGQHVPESEIEEIQWNWQEAIEQFLVTQSSRASELDESEDIIAVHDGSRGSFLFDRIQRFYEDIGEPESEQLRSIIEELETMLQKFAPREAVARFRPLLPEAWRYDLIDKVRLASGSGFIFVAAL